MNYEQSTGPFYGAWVIVDRDPHENITMVFQSELDALRAANVRGYGRVVLVPYGKTLQEAEA